MATIAWVPSATPYSSCKLSREDFLGVAGQWPRGARFLVHLLKFELLDTFFGGRGKRASVIKKLNFVLLKDAKAESPLMKLTWRINYWKKSFHGRKFLSWTRHRFFFWAGRRAWSSLTGGQTFALPRDTKVENPLRKTDLKNSLTKEKVLIAENLSRKLGPQVNDLLDSFASDFTYPATLPSYNEEYFEDQDAKPDSFGTPVGRIRCLPLPGNFSRFL